MNTLTIKTTKIEYKKGRYWHIKRFEKIYSDKDCLCLIDGEIISKEEGNNIFLSLMKEEDFSFSMSEKEVLKEELISSYRNKIDNSVAYIDNYNQQKKAEANNERLLSIVSALEKL